MNTNTKTPAAEAPSPISLLQVEHAQRLRAIEDRLDKGSARMDTMQAELKANTAVTTEVRDILTAAKGAFRVLGGLGVVAKWVSAIAGACIAIYTAAYMATHGGQPPGK